MKVGISPVQPLCSQENCTSNWLSWHNRWGHVSWLLTQKSSSHGPLTFFSSLASISVLRRARLLSWQNSSSCLKANKTTPQLKPQPVSSVVLHSSSPQLLFPQVCLSTARGKRQNPWLGMHQQTAQWLVGGVFPCASPCGAQGKKVSPPVPVG